MDTHALKLREVKGTNGVESGDSIVTDSSGVIVIAVDSQQMQTSSKKDSL